jgi:hypothetical protein
MDVGIEITKLLVAMDVALSLNRLPSPRLRSMGAPMFVPL